MKLVSVAFGADHRHINIIQNKCSDDKEDFIFMGNGKVETKNNSFTKRIGATTYVVNVHFAETDSVTAEDRLLHLIRNDIRVNGLPVVAEE